MPRKVDHQKRREAFAEAAFRTIARRGLAGATVREVAKEAGFTTGALVHYFQSKDDLLITASEYSGKVVRSVMETKERALPGIEALRFVLYEALPRDGRERQKWNVWLGFWERSVQSKAVRAVTRDRYREWKGRISRLLRKAQAAGDLARNLDVSKTADATIALIDGIGVQVLLAGGHISPRRQKALVDLFIETLPPGPRRLRRGRNVTNAKARSNGVRQQPLA
jgi:AcrR family transcriptional regulator